MKSLQLAVILTVAMALSIIASPLFINYQGRLLDDQGTPVNDTVPVSVTVWTAETGGAQVFTQNVGNVTVENGLYDFSWGDAGLTTALTNAQIWLQVQVDGEILTPRQRLLAVPYAVQAGSLSEGGITALAINETLAEAYSGGGTPPMIRTFETSGTWTKPDDLKYIVVELVGGGGAGGGGPDQGDVGGGGGGGGYAKKYILEEDLSATETVTVGSGGDVQGIPNWGTAPSGGTSSFGSHLQATGGIGGRGNRAASYGGAGGTGSGGDVNLIGQGGGGGFGTWNEAVNQFMVLGGAGGSSQLGGGARGSAGQGFSGMSGVTPAPGSYGGGGGGAALSDGTDRLGGNGHAGVVLIYEYY